MVWRAGFMAVMANCYRYSAVTWYSAVGHLLESNKGKWGENLYFFQKKLSDGRLKIHLFNKGTNEGVWEEKSKGLSMRGL